MYSFNRRSIKCCDVHPQTARNLPLPERNETLADRTLPLPVTA